LVFEWADTFNPDRKPLAWLFDHKRRRSVGLVRAWRSWGRAMSIVRFWGDVSPTHKTSPAVWLWPVVVFGSLIFVGGTARAIEGCFARYPWFPYVLTGSFAGRPPRPDGPGLLARLFEFVYLTWCYPLWYHNYANWPHEQYVKQLLAVWALPAATAAASLVCGLTLLCLSSSRRVSAVRGAHIARAMVYRLAPLVVVYAVWITFFVLNDFTFGLWSRPWVRTVWGTLLVGSLVWGWLWWWSAVTRGRLMPRARSAAALIGVVDVLTAAAVFLLMSPDFSRDFIE
jgi:hypothetical protein